MFPIVRPEGLGVQEVLQLGHIDDLSLGYGIDSVLGVMFAILSPGDGALGVARGTHTCRNFLKW